MTSDSTVSQTLVDVVCKRPLKKDVLNLTFDIYGRRFDLPLTFSCRFLEFSMNFCFRLKKASWIEIGPELGSGTFGVLSLELSSVTSSMLLRFETSCSKASKACTKDDKYLSNKKKPKDFQNSTPVT